MPSEPAALPDSDQFWRVHMRRLRSVRGLTAIKARAALVIDNAGSQRSTLEFREATMRHESRSTVVKTVVREYPERPGLNGDRAAPGVTITALRLWVGADPTHVIVDVHAEPRGS